MRLGVLDIGSNTVHLVAVDAHPGANPSPYSTHKTVLRLMRYLQADGSISEEGIAALVKAISAAARSAEAERIDKMISIATSAIRDAVNGADVIARIEAETGVSLMILSGEDEARLTFLAIRRWFGWSSGNILMFDIGGGSLEIAAGSAEYPSVAVSVPLGAGRTTVNFLPDDPPKDDQIKSLRKHAAAQLQAALPEFSGLPAPDHVVGSSKTIRSLARLAGSTTARGGLIESWLRRKDLKNWIPRLAALPADRRSELPGVTADRSFQIVGGAVVLHEAMKTMRVAELQASPWALREGVILRHLDGMEL